MDTALLATVLNRTQQRAERGVRRLAGHPRLHGGPCARTFLEADFTGLLLPCIPHRRCF